MDRFTADLRDLDRIDIQKLASSLPSAPARNKFDGARKSLLKSSIELGASFDSRMGLFLEPFKVADCPPAVSIQAPNTVPIGAMGQFGGGTGVGSSTGAASTGAAGGGTPFGFTLGLGAQGSAGAIAGFGLGIGLYGGRSPSEVGIYGSGSTGIWLGASASVGVVLTFILGPPSDFLGVSHGVGADYAPPGPSWGVGAMLLFGGTPYHFYGIAINASYGVALTTLTFKLEASNTKPLLRVML